MMEEDAIKSFLEEFSGQRTEIHLIGGSEALSGKVAALANSFPGFSLRTLVYEFAAPREEAAAVDRNGNIYYGALPGFPTAADFKERFSQDRAAGIGRGMSLANSD